MADKNVNNTELQEESKPNGFLKKVGNFFSRAWAKTKKFFKDTFSEMKKVVWLSKKDTIKNTELVIATVIAVGILIAIIDLACSKGINALAGLIG